MLPGAGRLGRYGSPAAIRSAGIPAPSGTNSADPRDSSDSCSRWVINPVRRHPAGRDGLAVLPRAGCRFLGHVPPSVRNNDEVFRISYHIEVITHL